MRKLLYNKKGFTLVELMVVVIIVGILAAVAVPLYRSNVQRALASEGKALVGSIRTAQRVYFAEHGVYGAWADISAQIDLTGNKYFTAAPTVTGGGTAAFTASVTGTGDAASITVQIDQVGTITTTPAGL
ncbi:MAG: prepilin-type N-terminal cleavage/methylation domain-containing protein [Candidatus Ratteibacteria bacterium]|nr:prepilin-type N-terminal cleavage/methylation domain-containing protein [Candidatus Ratteibacteria bacterium]